MINYIFCVIQLHLLHYCVQSLCRISYIFCIIHCFYFQKKIYWKLELGWGKLLGVGWKWWCSQHDPIWPHISSPPGGEKREVKGNKLAKVRRCVNRRSIGSKQSLGSIFFTIFCDIEYCCWERIFLHQSLHKFSLRFMVEWTQVVIWWDTIILGLTK